MFMDFLHLLFLLRWRFPLHIFCAEYSNVTILLDRASDLDSLTNRHNLQFFILLYKFQLASIISMRVFRQFILNNSVHHPKKYFMLKVRPKHCESNLDSWLQNNLLDRKVI